jgi:hypothetical protein
MHPTRSVPSLAVAALATLIGCELFSGPCTLEARPAITVVVQDSLTGSAPDTAGARVVAMDGAYADTARWAFPHARGGTEYTLALERAGVYVVRVEYPGYRVWEQRGIRVRDGDCHVNTVQVFARLRVE